MNYNNNKTLNDGFDLNGILGAVTSFTNNAGSIARSGSDVFGGASAGAQQAQVQQQQQAPIVQYIPPPPPPPQHKGFEQYLTPTNLIIGGVGLAAILLLSKHK